MTQHSDEGDLRTRAERLVLQANQLIGQSNALVRQTDALLSESKLWEPALKMGSRKGRPVWPLDWAVEMGLRLTHASRGNLQIFDPISGALQIAAQNGFNRQFLQHFDCVYEGEAAACGRAMGARRRVIVEDVTKSSIFKDSPALKVLLDAGVRAVQSTPVVSRSGAFLGMLSTHWTSPPVLSGIDWKRLDVLAESVADLLDQG